MRDVEGADAVTALLHSLLIAPLLALIGAVLVQLIVLRLRLGGIS